MKCKKINEKNLKKLYIDHCENSVPDMDSLWEKIESGLEEKSENRVTSRPVITVNFRKVAAWCAVCAAVMIAVPSFIFGNKNSNEYSIMSADNGAAINYEVAADTMDEISGNSFSETFSSSTDIKDGHTSAEYAPQDYASEEAIRDKEEVTDKVYYNDLSLAPVLNSNNPLEMPYAETSGDDFFVEDNVLIETDIIVDAVVDMVYSSGKGTVCYVLSAEDTDKNDMSSITVESATPYLLKMNREYILPLKENDGKYSLAFENAPQIECTLDGGIIFHNGWESLSEDSCEVIYPQNGIDDFFYDRMRFSYADGMTVLTDKWLLLKNDVKGE